MLSLPLATLLKKSRRASHIKNTQCNINGFFHIFDYLKYDAGKVQLDSTSRKTVGNAYYTRQVFFMPNFVLQVLLGEKLQEIIP